MKNFIYPITLVPDDDGGFVVKSRDFPEAVTQGDDLADALNAGSDCLEEAVANRIVLNLPLPRPSRVRVGEHPVALSTQIAAKAALYVAMRNLKMSAAQLAANLNCEERDVIRLLNPRRQSPLDKIEFALSTLGQELVVGFISSPLKIGQSSKAQLSDIPVHG